MAGGGYSAGTGAGQVESNNSDVRTRIENVFAYWTKTKCCEYSWKTMYDVLTSKHVDEQSLASQIKSKYLIGK